MFWKLGSYDHFSMPNYFSTTLYINIFNDMIYLLTANGLTPGGSSTVHIYTQTIHRTTQNKYYIEQILEEHLLEICCFHDYIKLQVGNSPLFDEYCMLRVYAIRKKSGYLSRSNLSKTR